jgi:hypothetical protein
VIAVLIAAIRLLAALAGWSVYQSNKDGGKSIIPYRGVRTALVKLRTVAGFTGFVLRGLQPVRPAG